MREQIETKVCIIGAGLAGLTAALNYAAAGQDTSREVAKTMIITARQAAAARAALGMSRAELTAAAKVGERTIVDFERGGREPIQATRGGIQAALEARGAEFLPDDGLLLPGTALAVGVGAGGSEVTE